MTTRENITALIEQAIGEKQIGTTIHVDNFEGAFPVSTTISFENAWFVIRPSNSQDIGTITAHKHGFGARIDTLTHKSWLDNHNRVYDIKSFPKQAATLQMWIGWVLSFCVRNANNS